MYYINLSLEIFQRHL